MSIVRAAWRRRIERVARNYPCPGCGAKNSTEKQRKLHILDCQYMPWPNAWVTEEEREKLRKNARTASLKSDIEQLRPQLADAANKVIDEWEQNEEGYDEEFGTGGVCDRVAQEMGSVIRWDTHEGGADGDDHSWVIVVRDDEVVGVDVHPGVYETGGGYSWTKIPDAHVRPEDVEVFELDIPASEFEEEW